MPRATINTEGTRYELNNLPDGYVVLRQLSFGEMLKRRDLTMKFMQELVPNAKPGDVSKVHVDILNEVTRKFDFLHCIIDHNLEDERGHKLDLGNQLALDILDVRIAAEIERLIDGLNQEDFDGENFTLPSESTSTGTSNGSQSTQDTAKTLEV